MSFRLTYATMFNPPEEMHERFERALAKMRGELGKTHPMFVGGKDVSAAATDERRSPIDNQILIGRFPHANAKEVDAAIAAAQGAFPGWRDLGAAKRVALMRKVARVLEERVYDIAAALVLVPLSQGLSYHLGFVNYLWSLPLLGLALEDLSRFAEADARAGARLAVWLAVWLGGLYLSHPFTFLGFLGLGALRLLFSAPGARVRGALLLTLSGLVFGLWFALADGGRGATGPEGIVWLPVAKSFLLLTLPLGGMYGGGEPAWAPLFVWLAIGAILLHAAWRERGSSPERRFWTLALFLLVVATFVAPFRAGHYSYINARLPDVSFLCLAIAAGTLRLPVASRVACTALVAGALVLSVLQQQRVAHELEEVAPLFEAIPRDAAVLPLVFDASSPELEPSVFDPHRHVHDMFHVRRGGGVTPYFFPHPLAPVRYRAGSPPAAPPQDRPAAYRFDRHGGYAYLLVRAAPPRVLRRLLAHSEQVAASGSWLLLRGRDRAATAGQHSIGVTVSRPNGRQPASRADP